VGTQTVYPKIPSIHRNHYHHFVPIHHPSGDGNLLSITTTVPSPPSSVLFLEWPQPGSCGLG